jgi:hypothetical protein
MPANIHAYQGKRIANSLHQKGFPRPAFANDAQHLAFAQVKRHIGQKRPIADANVQL